LAGADLPLERLRTLGADDSMVAAEATYRSPARFYDLLVVHVRTSHLGRSSYKVDFLVTRGEAAEVVAEGRTVHVIVDLQTRRPVPIPEPFRAAVRAFEGEAVVVAEEE
jgi:acyl-CoA thioester hydrolase